MGNEVEPAGDAPSGPRRQPVAIHAEVVDPAHRGFRPGDVACLKSGGPKMTVKFWDGTYKEFLCEWFDAKHELHAERFDPASLVKVQG